jgi:hypothetical protein
MEKTHLNPKVSRNPRGRGMVKTRINRKKIPALKTAEIAIPFAQDRSPISKAVLKRKMVVENR